MTGQQFAIVIRPFAKILLFMIVSDKRDPPDRGPLPAGTQWAGKRHGALSCAHACRPAASYLAAPTYRRWRGCPSSRGAFSLQAITAPG
jgi:hypothetical protein